MIASSVRLAHAVQILQAALHAVNGASAVKNALTRNGTELHVRSPDGNLLDYDLTRYRHVFVVGCGKAAVPMARAVEEILGDRINAGLVVTRHGHNQSPNRFQSIEIVEAGHPEPDEAGFAATERTLDLMRHAGAKDLVIALISGGGSAMWVQPPEGITLDDLARTSHLLLGSGASIREFNAVRKRLSRIAGGRAARVASPAHVLVLVISDVIGDPLDVIASGPFSPDSSDIQDAWDVVNRYGVRDLLPKSVAEYLRRELESGNPEQGSGTFDNIKHAVCASNAAALRAACAQSDDLGYFTEVISSKLDGEASQASVLFCESVLSRVRTGRRLCVLGGGETTVTLGDSPGRGGRNQEFALSAAFRIQEEGITILSCGTDGSDGPTDAAGAVVDGTTIARSHALGLDPQKALCEHDAYPLFERLGDLIKTGPTGTNVMDIQIALT